LIGLYPNPFFKMMDSAVSQVLTIVGGTAVALW
jgi:NADH:ubiquinone oxidoreductase subunit 4 (subunit M)